MGDITEINNIVLDVYEKSRERRGVEGAGAGQFLPKGQWSPESRW